MSNEAKSAFGMSLSWGGNTIAGIETITYSGITMNMASVLPHDAASRFAKVVATVGDGGEIGITGDLYLTDTDGQIAAIADAKAGTEREAIITGPTAAPFTWTMDAVFTNFTPEFNKEGVLGYSATLKVSGEPVFAITSVTGMSACGFSNDVLMMPAFAIGVYRYVVTITAEETSTVITPVDASEGEIITIYTDGGSPQVVTSGEASSACTLDVDDTTVITVVISHATKASKTYTFNCAVLAA